MNEIKFEIGDAKRSFSLGLGFLGKILFHFDTDMIGFGHLISKNPYIVTPAILYHSHKVHCEMNGKVVDFTIYDVEKWIEGMDNTINNGNIENLLIKLLDSINSHLPKAPEDDKKKAAAQS